MLALQSRCIGLMANTIRKSRGTDAGPGARGWRHRPRSSTSRTRSSTSRANRAEIEACYQWLERELEVVAPKLIVARGEGCPGAARAHEPHRAQPRQAHGVLVGHADPDQRA